MEKSGSQRIFFAMRNERVVGADEKVRVWNESERHVDVEGDEKTTRLLRHRGAVGQVNFHQRGTSV